MEYNIPIEDKDYHKAILKILNFNLGLTDTEIDIVATLLDYNVTIVDSKARDIIRRVLNKDKFNTNNYVSKLKAKHIFVVKPSDNKVYINPSILEIVKDKKVSFEFSIQE